MIWESLMRFELKSKITPRDALGDLLEKSGFLDEFDKFSEMENLFSFGIGKGVVLYKKRTKVDSPGLYIDVVKPPIEYDSFDGVPISIFCLLVSPLDDSVHLRYLSLFYRLINFSSFRERLLEANSLEGVRKLVKREEEGFES
ncbi:PTS sugar transporter subunit IIA [candidate division WOR-3 bacterium]|nr:PTS sugar transporter subunit IIA [candidate division WOR-3 bacterium]